MQGNTTSSTLYSGDHEPAERKRIPVTVPKGTVVTVVNGPLDGTRLRGDGDAVMMFTRDLRERRMIIAQASAE
jgi:hypothetical protein